MADANKHTVIKAGQIDADSLPCPPFNLLFICSVYMNLCVTQGLKKMLKDSV